MLASAKCRFVLQPWQAFVYSNLFGWVNPDNSKRRFRRSYIEVPRKNGKSFSASGLGLDFHCHDEPGGQICVGASTEDQADFAFQPMRQMLKVDLEYHEDNGTEHEAIVNRFGITVAAERITRPGNNHSYVRRIIGKPGDGGNPTLAIVDEFHQHETSALFDTMAQGMRARHSPLMYIITTAGNNVTWPCYEYREYVISCLNDFEYDDGVFGLIFTLDEGDDWRTMEAFAKANPCYGAIISKEAAETDLREAIRSPAKQIQYKQKALNLWGGSVAGWMDMMALQKCVDKSLKIEDFEGLDAYLAVDLSEKLDLSSIGIMIPLDGLFYGFHYHYLPWQAVYGPNAENQKYREWVQEGFIEIAGDHRVDNSVMQKKIIKLHQMLFFSEYVYDTWHAKQFEAELAQEGIPGEKFGQGWMHYSEPTKAFEACVLENEFRYSGNPVTTVVNCR